MLFRTSFILLVAPTIGLAQPAPAVNLVESGGCPEITPDDPSVFICDESEQGPLKTTRLCKWAGPPEVKDWYTWVAASVGARCMQTEKCDIEFPVSLTQRASIKFGPRIDAGSIVNQTARSLVGLAPSKRIAKEATRNASFTCRLRQGYQGQVYLQVDKRTIKGQLITNYIEYNNGNLMGVKCERLFGSMIVPIVEDDGGLKSVMECTQTPSADVRDVSYEANVKNLSDEEEDVEALMELLEKLTKDAPPRGLSVLKTVKGKNKKIYGRARCFSLSGGIRYEAICEGCLHYAKNNILSRSKHSAGVDWRLKDCSIRYELYPFH